MRFSDAPARKALRALSREPFSIREALKDPARLTRFTLRHEDLIADFSKSLVSDTALGLLLELAEQRDLAAGIEAMFRGDAINLTEKRSVLHVALRNRSERSILVGGRDVMPDVRAVLSAMRDFVGRVQDGSFVGKTGKPITDVVNIGIGGSDLGPAMVAEALEPYWHPRIVPHFVSNVDGAHLGRTLKRLSPETTLFVVASKTFTTQETLANAKSARAWLTARLGEDAVASHFVAVSTNLAAVSAFGIDPKNAFGFWDWVGGRYSLWSAIGLPVALAVGMDRFEELLAGAFAMDEHFRTAPFAQNLPVISALLGVYYTDVLGAHSFAVLPYDQSLARLPAWLQQGDMESNGKGVTREGVRITENETGPIVWGEPGTNGQHAFYQLIHQGTRLVPVEFLAPLSSHYDLGAVDHHAMLLSNLVAQSEALMIGKTQREVEEELRASGASPEDVALLAPHKVFPGNRPSHVLLFERLDPRTLGKLLAYYEHRIFVQGWLWGVNSFDQWGVELGKKLATGILEELKAGGSREHHDASTRAATDRVAAALQRRPASPR
jgi:glucose-6-phosphate isomerase